MDKEFFSGLKLIILEGTYSLVKSKNVYPQAFANIQDEDEITVVIKDNVIEKEDIISIEKAFKIVTFDSIIPLNLIGFIAKISQLLAKENISIFVISSFSKEYVLIKEKSLKKAVSALKKIGVKI
ncbi:MAG: ACT domain-containing protein [Candidatus Pacearchaeota archaeon]|jgi:hypothetical protein